MRNSFSSRAILEVGGKKYRIHRLDALTKQGFDIARLPYCLRVLLENLLRFEDGVTVDRDDIEALANWDPKSPSVREIAFSPARTILQDFTGVPVLVDLAAMRDAIAALGGNPKKINPLQPVELVIDHSIQVDAFGSSRAFEQNIKHDYQRNTERYAFLRWGQRAFDNFNVVPPNGGIVHQVNLEYLSRVVFSTDEVTYESQDIPLAYPDSCVGTDSHTPMVNGLGVLAWGVGGIEAEATMLGQPISMLIPDVIGFRLEGELPPGTTATDLVLHITEMLRHKGVVGKFVEFYGPGLSTLSLPDRATIGNMAPEYGATCAIFPPDDVTLQYLRFTGRSEERVALVEAYMNEQGLFHDPLAPEPIFTDTLTLDLRTIEPSLAGPKRPQDRIPLSQVRNVFEENLESLKPNSHLKPHGSQHAKPAGVDQSLEIHDGSIVIAAITSCTNTSNPAVMMAAGLLAKKAVEKGLTRRPWVKTSLAPGSMVVTRYLDKAGLTPYLDQLGFNLAGYGCTTCIGNSGPLPPEISAQIQEHGLVTAAVLSGNRNFEGRINTEVRANFLMSPPLVVAFALKGKLQWDPASEPIGKDKSGRDVFLKDLWPSEDEIAQAMQTSIESDMYRQSYATIFEGDERWRSLKIPDGDLYRWDESSSYSRQPPYFVGMKKDAGEATRDINGARALLVLGDSVTTDHISPAGSIRVESPAGQYLIKTGVAKDDFNSYGARRGNHEVMMRGTFANNRIRNQIARGTEGGFTTYFPENKIMSVYEAAIRYQRDGTPLCVLAGPEYGSGSSRDWAAKGPKLQGVRFVLAESFERIHRSNLVGMGILPLEFLSGENIQSLGLSGQETFDVLGLTTAIDRRFQNGRAVTIRATDSSGPTKTFKALIRIDTPQELLYYRHGGILPYVIRQLLTNKEKPEAISRTLAATPQSRPGGHPDDKTVQQNSEASFPASDAPAY